ncbi:MAG: type II toxin-antitoxin system VapC family toxin [Steroidobacteraceae bacterium]
MLVIDASVALGWLLDDERTASSLQWLDQLRYQRAIVPAFFWLEVGNALHVAVRRKRLAQPPLTVFDSLRRLPITADTESPAIAAREAIDLAARYDITVYDSAYLELALRTRSSLATHDAALAAAARQAGISL